MTRRTSQKHRRLPTTFIKLEETRCCGPESCHKSPRCTARAAEKIDYYRRGTRSSMCIWIGLHRIYGVHLSNLADETLSLQSHVGCPHIYTRKSYTEKTVDDRAAARNGSYWFLDSAGFCVKKHCVIGESA